MQRRDFVRTALLGTGAVCSLALPSAYAALNTHSQKPLRTALARLETRDRVSRWRSLDRCSSEACSAPQRVRVAIDALAFPTHFGALSIDAMFDTHAGVKPFRVASHQPDSLSPSSKPFAFEADSAGLAGFRVEHAAVSTGSSSVCASSLLGATRPVLAAGRYLLVISRDEGMPEFESIGAPESAAHPIVDAGGNDPHFAWLTFSVQPQIG